MAVSYRVMLYTRAMFLVLAGLICTACNEKALQNKGDQDASVQAPAGALTPELAAKVLAKVGDHVITLGDYAAALEHMDAFDRLRYQSQQRRKELLNEIINVELLAAEATAKGYDKEPLAQQELREILRDAILHDVRKQVPPPNDVPEPEIRAYFEAHKNDYRDPERRRISVIVVHDDSAATSILETAKKGLSNTQWGELVRSKSIDSQAKANVPVDLAGDFGVIDPPNRAKAPSDEHSRVPEEVRLAAYEIAKVGDVLDRPIKVPIKANEKATTAATAGGKGTRPAATNIYLVRLTQKIEARERSYQEAERSIRVKLTQEKIKAKEDELLAKLRTQFPVRIDDAVLATVKVDVSDAGAAIDASP